MLPTDPMRPAIQGIILDNIDGEGLDDFKEYNRNQLLISGIAKPHAMKREADCSTNANGSTKPTKSLKWFSLRRKW